MKTGERQISFSGQLYSRDRPHPATDPDGDCSLIIGRIQVSVMEGVHGVERYTSVGEDTRSRRSVSYMAFTVVRSLPNNGDRLFMLPPGVSEVLRTRPLHGSVQLKRVVVTRGTSWIISLIPRLIVNRKDGLRTLIPYSRRERTVGEFVRQVGVVLAIREVRDS